MHRSLRHHAHHHAHVQAGPGKPGQGYLCHPAESVRCAGTAGIYHGEGRRKGFCRSDSGPAGKAAEGGTDLQPDESVDLVCTHPPYADIIKYSNGLDADLSQLKIVDFLEEMKKVAAESYRVLKKGKFCAVLMGDTRQNGHMIPMSFEVMRIFENAGFKLKELIIKEQHNCKATGYWKTNSVKYNFLLIAHEYLFVFKKA